MWQPKKILIPTDFSQNANEAMLYAHLFARIYNTQCTLFHVISLFDYDPNNPNYNFPSFDDVYNTHEQIASEEIDKLHVKDENILFEKKIVRGVSAADEIINFAGENGYDLIIMGTHGRSGLSHFFIGSVTEKVIRHQPCPVMAVRYQRENAIPERFEKILVPVDFSNYSRKTLEYAVELATNSDAFIELIHVIEEQIHPAYYVAGDVSILKMFPDLREKSTTALRELAENNLKQDIKFSCHVKEGKSHTEIVDFADEQDIDLIVMATHGLSGFEHFLMGSTTEKVLRKSSTPILAIKIK
ncbi:MAG: universal stress protein [Calditrichaeota bacterium]|nr:MAG: universal stress protein [Calditrichota bacterium]